MWPLPAYQFEVYHLHVSFTIVQTLNNRYTQHHRMIPT